MSFFDYLCSHLNPPEVDKPIGADCTVRQGVSVCRRLLI